MLHGMITKAASRPYLILTLTALFWAGNAIAGKLASGVFPPLTLTWVRWVLTALIFYIFARPHLPKARDLLRARWVYLALMGIVGFAGFNFALYGALNFTSAINVTIEQSAMPMLIMLMAFLVFGERIRLGQLVGAAFAILGVMVTASHGDLAALLRLDLNIGDAIMVIGVIVYSAYSVGLRKKPALDWRVFMFALAVSAAIVSLPFAVIEVMSGHYPEASWRAPAIIAYIVIFPSLLSQIFFIRGVELIGANRAGQFVNLVPIFGAVLAIIILGERFQSYHAAGLALVLGGIAIAEITARQK